MLVFLDTNVVLDFLLERDPWFTDAAAFWQAIEDGSITGCISASSVTNIYYIARRLVSPLTAHEAIRHCLDAFTIVSVGRDVLDAPARYWASTLRTTSRSCAPRRHRWMRSSRATARGFAGLRCQS